MAQGDPDLLNRALDELARLRAENERLSAAVESGVKMRETQRRYFKTRDRSALVESKQAEAAFDKAASSAK